MILGALLDLGLPLDALQQALGSLALDCGRVSSERVLRAGVAATKFRLLDAPPDLAHPAQEPAPARQGHDSGRGVKSGPDQGHHHHDHPDHDHPDHHRHASHSPGHHHHGGHDHGHEPARQSGAATAAGQPHHHAHHHHSLSDIARHIDRSALSAEGKDRAKQLFQRLAEAEAAIHEMPVERVHLHEVGALDSIVDIVGAVFGMEWLGATRIAASPLNVGSGTVVCAHGVYPVPAPATARLLTGVPVYSGGVDSELTTPTGALLVTGYAEDFGAMPPMRISAIGYGAGDKDFARHPNVLRLLVGDAEGGATIERVVTVECEIDDMNPQLFGPLMDRLYAAGALDVYYAAVQMKKNRPGTLVTVVAAPGHREKIVSELFAETTTIGVRYQEMARERLERQVITIDTPVGPIRVKVARRAGRVVNASPEFEDCAAAAARQGIPIKDVQALATRAWLESAH